MARAVSRGMLYSCQFPNNGFTSVSGPQVVVVLIPRYGGNNNVCLVAGAWLRSGKWGMDFTQVHTVPVARLEAIKWPIDESRVKAAKRRLGEAIRSAN